MVAKWTGSGLEVTGSGPEVGQKWTGCVHLSVRTSVHPKHFPYLLDEPYARDLQAQGACALRFFSKTINKLYKNLHISLNKYLVTLSLTTKTTPCVVLVKI